MPRTYSQLLADAIATGTFENYSGDGASVPWQVALPGQLPIGFTLLTYKVYLDANFPNAFKLHDWCYTPYGVLINCTREEADAAMFEEIARTSPIDAWITWTAVRVGGGPYFGFSQTGYVGLQSYRPVANIDPTQGDC
jgi:hypothetical protein